LKSVQEKIGQVRLSFEGDDVDSSDDDLDNDESENSEDDQETWISEDDDSPQRVRNSTMAAMTARTRPAMMTFCNEQSSIVCLPLSL
jgi:hypothetical protein